MKYSAKQLKAFSTQLNHNLPKAERWFWNLWLSQKMYCEFDQPNECFGCYIPDLLNKKWKYVIEIDESHHQTSAQQVKDLRRDNWFIRKGYFVFRIPAYDLQKYGQVVTAVKKLRKQHQPSKIKLRVKKLSYFQKLKIDRVVAYKTQNPEKPNSSLGKKLICPLCQTKFYTLNKNNTCPRC